MACKLLWDLEEGRRLNIKNNIDNKASATPISDNFDQGSVKNFIAEQVKSPAAAKPEAVFDAGDIAGGAADKDPFGTNMNIDSIQMQVANIKYLAMTGSGELVEKYAIGWSKANKKLRVYIIEDNAARMKPE